MEDILAIVFIFGGATFVGVAFSPVGRALADRIRGHALEPQGTDPAILDELDRLRQDVAELQERADFAERLLAKGPDATERAS